MNGVILGVNGMVNLQASLASQTWGPEEVFPHHPIMCLDRLELDEDGLRCPHAGTSLTQRRTVECLNYSIALLLIEIATHQL